MAEVTMTACSHEKQLFDVKERDVLVNTAVEILKTWSDEFDAIAISGYSSAMIVPIIANALKKNIVLVRKASESRYSSYETEGIHGQRVLFFDDLVSTGTTARRITDGLKTIDCKMVGYYLYKVPHGPELTDIMPDAVNMMIPKVMPEVKPKAKPCKREKALKAKIDALNG